MRVTTYPHTDEGLKTKCAAPSKLKAAQSGSYKSPKLSIGWQPEHVHTQVANLYPDDQLAVS